MNFRLSANTADEIVQQVKRCSFNRPEIAVKAQKMLLKYHLFPGVWVLPYRSVAPQALSKFSAFLPLRCSHVCFW